MNAIKKTFKVKGVRERITLMEFMVKKRTKFLDYLKELHSVNGAFWMNVVQINIFDISKHFRVSDDCMRQSNPNNDPVNSCPRHENEDDRPSSPRTTSLPREQSGSLAEASPDSVVCSEDFFSRYLPALAALGVSLSEILLAPLSAKEFVDCIYGLLLEVEVAYAGGSTTRAIALHNLNSFRETYVFPQSEQAGESGGFSSLGQHDSLPPLTSTESNEIIAKYIFLKKETDDYMAAPVSYDTVISPLCTILALTYRKLFDFEEMANAEVVKRVIAIDKKLEKIFFTRITDEIEVIARKKLFNESLVLTNELFSGFAEEGLETTLPISVYQHVEPAELSMAAESPTSPRSDDDA